VITLADKLWIYIRFYFVLLYGNDWIRVTLFLGFCVCFVDRCFSFCTFSFGHCVVCSSSIDGFWLPLCYLQTLLTAQNVQTEHPIWQYRHMDTSKNSRLFVLVNNLSDSDCMFASWRQRKQRFKDQSYSVNRKTGDMFFYSYHTKWCFFFLSVISFLL
jgi:hypothetical protein